MKIRKLLEATTASNSDTSTHQYVTKEYVKCLFYRAKSTGVKAGYVGSRGQHAGSGIKRNIDKGQSKVSPTQAITSEVNAIMEYEINGFGKIRSLPKFPRYKLFENPEKRLEYLKQFDIIQTIYSQNNPRLVKYIEDEYVYMGLDEQGKLFPEFAEDFNKVTLPAGTEEDNLFKAFTYFINTLPEGNGIQDQEKWKEILSKYFIQGEDREVIAGAIDYFESLSKIVDEENDISKFELYRKGDFSKLREDFIGNTSEDLDKFNQLLSPNNTLTVPLSNVINLIPPEYKKNISKDFGHNPSTLDLSDHLIGLLYIGSFTINTTNDVHQHNKREPFRSYIFLKIEKSKNGKYDSFPGNVQIVLFVAPQSAGNSLIKFDVYETYFSPEQLKEIFELNMPDGKGIHGKYFGPKESSTYGFQFPKEILPHLRDQGKLETPTSVNINKLSNNISNEKETIPPSFESKYRWPF